jgi:23S rRNA (uracil1939-C5)-methyltransferase
MRRKYRTSHQIIENLEIIDVGAEGKAIARHNEMVIFVTYAVPGDVVDVQINKKKKNYREGFPVKFHKYSEKRTQAFCEHFGVCGGCKWQNLPYSEQLFYKQKQVNDHLTRIGKLEIETQNPILASPNEKFYRNKLEFTFSNQAWILEEEKDLPEKQNQNALGFHIPGRFDKILNLQNCYLQKEPSNSIRLAIKEFAEKENLEFFDLRQNEGFLRTLIIRTSSTGELMVILTFYKENKTERIKLLEFLKQKFPQITSLMYVINSKANDTITDQEVILYSGKDHFFEQMEDLKFKIGAKSFYQTNSEQAYELYKKTRQMAQLTGNEIVYDLYTGTGTIANFVARNAHKVIGIEYVPEAIEDAKINSELNQIKNTRFFAGDLKDVFTKEFINANGKPDVVILDPPRAGMHPNVITGLLYAKPKRIVYVSCNPATQARDLALLNDAYLVKETQPVDMFPHTHHVENIVLLEKKM